MKEISLTRGFVARVDGENFEELSQYKWHVNKDGYAVRNVQDETGRWVEYMHRRLMGLVLNDGKIVDHIDGDSANNQLINLRLASHSQNMRNMRVRKNNTSGFKGVSYFKECGKWIAGIRINGKRRHLGLFETAEEAYAAYCTASAELHGEFGRIV